VAPEWGGWRVRFGPEPAEAQVLKRTVTQASRIACMLLARHLHSRGVPGRPGLAYDHQRETHFAVAQRRRTLEEIT